MNIKRLLLSLVLSLVASALASTSQAAEKDVGPKLGLQTWTLRNMSFDEVVQFAAANHIKYLQLTSQHLNPNAPPEETRRKKALLDAQGLVLYTFGISATTTDVEANRKLFEFARLIGARLIVVEPKLADWDSLEALVKEYDINLAIHNHGGGTTYGDPQVVKQMLATRDRRIGVCLDVGWITAAGFDAAQVFRDYGDRVYDIHLKTRRSSQARDRERSIQSWAQATRTTRASLPKSGSPAGPALWPSRPTVRNLQETLEHLSPLRPLFSSSSREIDRAVQRPGRAFL